jgi:hypothetical protein
MNTICLPLHSDEGTDIGDKKPNVVRWPELNWALQQLITVGRQMNFNLQKYTHVNVHQASQIFNWNHGDRHRKLGTRRKQKQQ